MSTPSATIGAKLETKLPDDRANVIVLAAKHCDLSCICVRIGSPGWDGEATHGSSNFGLSARDCGQLFARAVSVRDVQFAIVAGVSRHAASWMDVEHTSAVLGYEPQDGTAMARL